MPVVNPPQVPPLQGVSGELSGYLSQLTRWARFELSKLVPRNEGVNSIILISPSQKSYMVTVSDTGTITTTLMIPGKNDI